MFSLIIPTCIKTSIHLSQLYRCLESVRLFHKLNIIYLINDSDSEFNDMINNLCSNYYNIFIINSSCKGSADQQVFKVIIENNNHSDNDHFVILQDSMILNKMLDNVENINSIKFLWHFTNHRVHWNAIEEPITQFNIDNHIINHTDLIEYHLKNNYNYNKEFQNYAIDLLLNKKDNWCGCFGNCCITTKIFITEMNNKVNFINNFINCTNNRDRRVNESIFSLICHYYLKDINFEESYDGLYFDGYNTNTYSGEPTNYDNLTWCCKQSYISKISFNR